LPDFTIFWTAGRFALTDPSQVYNTKTMTVAQAWAVNPIQGPRPFSYPPSALLMMAPFGLMPFCLLSGRLLGLLGSVPVFALNSLTAVPALVASLSSQFLHVERRPDLESSPVIRSLIARSIRADRVLDAKDREERAAMRRPQDRRNWIIRLSEMEVEHVIEPAIPKESIAQVRILIFA